MAVKKWLTEIISGKTKIFITPTRYELAKEISRFLEKYSVVELVGEKEDYDLVIYLTGFEKLVWSETVQYTSALHTHLDQALKRKAKFILVVPSLTTSFGQVAQAIVEQFGKNFGLSYVIIETKGLTNPKQTAQAVVRAFISFDPPLAQTPQSELPKFLHAPPLEAAKQGMSSKLVFFSLLILLSPWLILASLVFTGGLSLKCLDWSLTTNHWPISLHCAQLASFTAQFALPLTVLTPGLDLAEPLTVVKAISPVITQANEVGQELLPFISRLVHPQELAAGGTIDGVSEQLSHLNESLSYLDSQLQTSSLPAWLAPGLPQKISAARKTVNQLTGITPLLTQLQSATPATWLVLLQDNSEVRPTGGFIEGIALVEIADGKIKHSQFLSTSEVDQHLRGQVVPPADLRQALGENNWYLRDANWDPDFTTTATKAAWFVNKELGQEVVGVVAMNLNTLRQMLPILGSADLADYGGKLTADNLWANYLGHLQFDTAQPKLLPRLTEQLYTSSQTASSAQLYQLASLALSNLESRQILVSSLTNPNLVPLAWRGQLTSAECISTYPCVNNQVYLVDSNVGVNKVDPDVSRQLALQLTVTPDQVISTYTWTYNHHGAVANWPGGNYKDWVRIYLPPTAQIEQVKLGETEITTTISPVIDHGLTKLALLLPLAMGENQQLSLRFTLPVPKAPRWDYQLSLPNQPGVAPYPVSLRVNYPSGWWVSASLPAQIASGASLGYNALTNRYLRWNFDWVPAP